MGLDNIPSRYPCIDQGTATLIPPSSPEAPPQIDCQQTQVKGGCPWKNNPQRPATGAVVGIMGTDCWYRGAAGNEALRSTGIDLLYGDVSFYGDNEEGTHKSPESCRETSTSINSGLQQLSIDSLINYYKAIGYGDEEARSSSAQAVSTLEYGAWWLNWVAEECGGADCWY